MNVADAIAATPGAKAALVTSADADESAFGALIDVEANDAGADVAAMVKFKGDRPTDTAAAPVRLPMATVHWSGLTAQSVQAEAPLAAQDGAGAAPDVPLDLAPADRGGATARNAVVADASFDPTPAGRGDSSTAMAAGQALHVVGGKISAPATVMTAAAIVESPVNAADTSPKAAPPAFTPRAKPTPSPSPQTAELGAEPPTEPTAEPAAKPTTGPTAEPTTEPTAKPPVSAAVVKFFEPRDLSAPPARTTISDVPPEPPRTVTPGTGSAAEASTQLQPDGADARATQSAAPTKRGADTPTALHTPATSLTTSGAPRLAKLVADAGNVATASTGTDRPAPSATVKVKIATDDTGELKDMPPTSTATVMPIDPSVAAIVAVVPTPSASLSPVKQDVANASAADGDRTTTATASPRAASTEPIPHGATPRTDDLLPIPAATPRDGQASAAALASPNAPTPTIAQPQPHPQPTMSASPVVAAQPGRIGRELGVQIARHVADGKSAVTIRLDPANMGRVDVRLSFDDTGRLTAAVHADNPASLAMLRNEASDLGRSLTDAGIRADVSAFSFDSRHDGGGSGQPGQQQPRQPQADTRYAAGHPDDDRLSFRSLRTSDRVDLIA